MEAVLRVAAGMTAASRIKARPLQRRAGGGGKERWDLPKRKSPRARKSRPSVRVGVAEDPERRKATQTSQRTAANMGRERIFLKEFIHEPGLGRKERRAGKRERRRTGRAKPRAREEKMRRVPMGGRAKAAARATPMKGAVQGEATATARRPEVKAPVQPWWGLLEARLLRKT